MIGDWSCGGLNVLGEAYCLANSNDDTTVANTDQEDLSHTLLLLSWRDPRQTGSDWTIVVVTNSDTDEEEEDVEGAASTTTYHVHKRILSVGPRSSRYFANVFQEKEGPQQHRYNQSQSTRITLDAHDAASFPVLLDFMYDPAYQQQQQQQNSGTGDNDEDDNEEDQCSMGTLAVADDLTPVHGVSLRHLARVFECDGLMVAVTKWIHHDLSGHTGPLYYVQAQVYGDAELFESAKRFCLEQFVQLETTTLLQLPLELFRSLIVEVINTTTTQHHLHRSSSTTSSTSIPSKSKTLNYDYTDGNNNEEAHIAEEKAPATNDAENGITTVSSHVSEVVCQYFETHPERLTVPVLLELTSPTVMPYIAAESAIGLTALIRRDVHPHDLPHHHPQDGDDDPDDDDWPRFVTLCARCAQAVVRQYGWKAFNIAAAVEEYVYGPSLCGDVRAGGATGRARLESLFFATSFSAALDRAQQEANQSEETSRSGSMTKKQQLETLQQHNEDLVWQNRKLQEEVDQYKTVLAGTNEELLMLRSQVKHLNAQYEKLVQPDKEYNDDGTHTIYSSNKRQDVEAAVLGLPALPAPPPPRRQVSAGQFNL